MNYFFLKREKRFNTDEQSKIKPKINCFLASLLIGVSCIFIFKNTVIKCTHIPTLTP